MFRNREDAAGQLADALEDAAPADPVVLALPRGGVPLGAVVAARLAAPLDLVMVRKIGMPTQPELAAGAVVDGPAPTLLFNEELLMQTGLTEKDFKPRIAELRKEIEKRRARYLPGRDPEPVAGRTAILVDDGVATGATMRVAIKALRRRDPAAVWVAVPVGPQDTRQVLEKEADRVICLEVPEPFWAVGAHYRDFGQVSDDEVVGLMRGVGGQATG